MKAPSNIFLTTLTILSTVLIFQLSAMSPNPIISRNKPVFGSPSANVTNLVNGKFGEFTWNVVDGSWAAINVGNTYSKIFISWNNPVSTWSDSIAAIKSCKKGVTIPVDYQIMVSPNSTNGIDGNWTVAQSISNNTVSARGHQVNFTGSSWVKMNITKGSGSIDEIEVFDLSNGSDDLWFFPGTSISEAAFKSNVPAENFADLITKSHSSFTPAIIRGAIPCILSDNMVSEISKYLNMARNVKFWAIEMGTNDAWSGSNYFAPTFKANLQLIIDSCKANGIQPIIARMISTDSAKQGWQVHPDFLKAIDDLTSQNKLIAGPDFYSYFSTHTSELSDGVHPNVLGGASIQRLWATKMDSLYQSSTAILTSQTSTKHMSGLQKIIVNGNSALHINCAGTLSVFSLKGVLVEKVILPANATYHIPKNNGVFIVHFSSQMGEEVLRVNRF